jgi:hypothetical protein
MAEITREQVLSALQNGWATYVSRFHKLSPAAQAAFLEKQGYTRFADLLAHVVAWWEEGEQVIKSILADPGFKGSGQEVDAFNARAVEKVRGLDEETVARSFEQMRTTWVDLVAGLPEGAFKNKQIADWLHADVVEHLSDHDIP